MKITDRQEEVLDQLVCQRLSAVPSNRDLIKSFKSAKGIGLVSYLLERGWREDSDGTTAFYVIKNNHGEILLFFSLKCGALFDPLDEEEIQERINYLNSLLEEIHADDCNRRENTLTLIEQVRSGFDISLDQITVIASRHVKTV